MYAKLGRKRSLFLRTISDGSHGPTVEIVPDSLAAPPPEVPRVVRTHRHQEETRGMEFGPRRGRYLREFTVLGIFR